MPGALQACTDDAECHPRSAKIGALRKILFLPTKRSHMETKDQEKPANKEEEQEEEQQRSRGAAYELDLFAHSLRQMGIGVRLSVVMGMRHFVHSSHPSTRAFQPGEGKRFFPARVWKELQGTSKRRDARRSSAWQAPVFPPRPVSPTFAHRALVFTTTCNGSTCQRPSQSLRSTTSGRTPRPSSSSRAISIPPASSPLLLTTS